MIHRPSHPLADVELTPAQAAAIRETLEARDRAVAEKARASVKPQVVDLEALRATVAKYAVPEPVATPSAHRTRVHYVRGGGAEEWSRGGWEPRDDRYWEAQSRRAGSSKLLEVGDVRGPTVIDHATFGRVVVRGCLIDGFRDVVRPATPIRLRKIAGTLCIECHRQWLEMSAAQRNDLPLWVTRRLREEGFLDPALPEIEIIRHSPTRSEEVPLVLARWRRYLWASRVLRSADPASQQPMSRPFNFLAGPIKVEEVSE